MKKIKDLLDYFTKLEWLIWGSSVGLIIISFFIFDRENYITLLVSLIGVTAIMINAKGNPIGQLLMVIFSLAYGVISYTCAYYGETITYVGMTLPMAVMALIAWMKNPYKGNHAEVKVNQISKKEAVFMCILAIVVTVLFYFILKYFHTANLVVSTFSILTSYIAAYLTFRRSPYFSLAYAINDVVLIVLWMSATLKDATYISVVVCFIAFLANDIYAFISWRKMERRQMCEVDE